LNIQRLAAVICVMTAAVSIQLYAQKTCFVASEAILDRFPEAKAARAKLTELQAGWLREIQRQQQDIDKLKADLENNRLLWSQQERREGEARLGDMESRLNSFRVTKFGASGELDTRQTELMGPVLDKVQKAIADEAKAQKYDFVLDKSSRGLPVLYANSSYDITAFVLKRLGVEVDASEFPKGDKDSTNATQSEGDARKNRTRRDQEPSIPVDPNKALDPGNGETKPQADPK
jgi:outer membrane protein